MNTPTAYAFEEGLVQAIVHNLNAQPAAQTRQLLNAIEGECRQQDEARVQAARDQLRADIEKQLKEAPLTPPAEAVQAPAAPPLDLPTITPIQPA
jgi:hypothetical protein